MGIVLGYSYTKRFTFLSHFILGIGLGLAPIGAFLAVSGEFKMLPILLSFAVWAWVSGFDILYSIQDLEFDRANNLFSVPAAFGIKSAILISRSMHLISALLIVSTAAFIPKSYLYISAVSLFCSLLIYQHSLVGSNKLDRINFAFFNLNGFASLLFSVLAVLAFCL